MLKILRLTTNEEIIVKVVLETGDMVKVKNCVQLLKNNKFSKFPSYTKPNAEFYVNYEGIVYMIDESQIPDFILESYRELMK